MLDARNMALAGLCDCGDREHERLRNRPIVDNQLYQLAEESFEAEILQFRTLLDYDVADAT